jgi:hypothetical protein
MFSGFNTMEKLRNDFEMLNKKISSNSSQADIEELTNILRDLRNLCASNLNVRQTLFDLVIELKSLLYLFEILLKQNQSYYSMLCVKIGLQVVGNTVVQNDIHCVEHVWNICHPFLL